MTERPEDNLQALWQGQQSEAKPMTVAAIRGRAARYTLVKRGSYLFAFALIALEVVMFSHYVLTIHKPLVQAGMLVVLIGLGWLTAIYSLGWPRRMPGSGASATSLLEFHRNELQRQKVGFGTLMYMSGPLLAGVVLSAVGGMLSAPHVRLVQAAPVFVLLGAWVVAAWFLSRRAERIRREKLAELEATRIDEAGEIR
jgi:hypothetical protein